MKQRPPRELQIPFDRVTYREGQLLASLDLTDDFGASQRLRRMHTRFLHNTWGIGLGFSVEGQPGDDSVHIGPGFAIDSSAREILLSADLSVPVPATDSATDLLLVIGYQPDSAYRDLPDIARLCAGTTLDPRDERPLFNWRTPDTFQPGPDVPLAHLRVQSGGLVLAPDLSVRRYAARVTRPHMATGSVETFGRNLIDPGLIVDTSDAGFAAAPEYFVRLDAKAGSDPKGAVLELIAQFVANSAFVESATPKSFKYFAPDLGRLGVAGIELQFVVTWLGVEPVTGCEPVSNPFRIFNFAGMLVSRAAFNKGVTV
jgi:hypothetical protein